MARPPRIAVGNMVYHVCNRGNSRMRIFNTSEDYQAFEKIIAQAKEKHPVRILAYCLMPNHWHFVLWPEEDGVLIDFVQWLANTHSHRWQAFRKVVGTGHLYQGRFRSFPVQSDEHFLTVCRYVERNALEAGLVKTADKWQWSSVWQREHGSAEQRGLLNRWPMERPREWPELLSKPQGESVLETLWVCENRGRPFGDLEWTESTAKRLDLEATLRSVGRPRKRT